jgi:SAM-dependent methyltransferase
MSTDDRITSEQRFHDERFASDEARVSGFAYSITGSSASAYHDLVGELVRPGTKVLELGCGDHSQAWERATVGADVLAIDISQVAVDAATRRAADEGFSGLSFRQMNAEELELDDSSVDLVIGSGILHHLDTPRAMAEIARVLRAGGDGVFLEPLGHNPLLRAYRRITPGDRTPDEHPLVRRDLDAMSEWFGTVDLKFFHLLSLAALAALKSDAFDELLHRLDGWDRRVLASSRRLQDQAWFVLIHVRDPKEFKH